MKKAAIKKTLIEKFRFNWKLTAFAGGLVPVFVFLGVWQLDRALWKAELLQQREASRAQPPVLASDLAPDEASERRVLLDGAFDPDAIYLLDNRVLWGRVGYEVIQRFHDIPSGLSFYINRGFVPMGATREDLPEIATPSDRVRVIASVYPLAGHQLDEDMAGPAPQDPAPGSDASPTDGASDGAAKSSAVIQRLAEIPTDHAFCLRLDLASIGALPRYWPSVTMTPETHKGYAFQWFIMAGALLVLWVWFSFPP